MPTPRLTARKVVILSISTRFTHNKKDLFKLQNPIAAGHGRHRTNVSPHLAKALQVELGCSSSISPWQCLVEYAVQDMHGVSNQKVNGVRNKTISGSACSDKEYVAQVVCILEKDLSSSGTWTTIHDVLSVLIVAQ